MSFGLHRLITCTISILITFTLTACGGGGGGGSKSEGAVVTPPPPPTAKEVVQQSPANVSSLVLKDNFTKFARSLYVGLDSDAPITGESVQTSARMAFGFGVEVPFPPYDVLMLPFNESPISTDIDLIFTCGESGTVNVNGKLSQQGFGNLELQYSDCVDNWNGATFNGRGIATISSSELESATVYFDELSVVYPDSRLEVSGYYEFSYDENGWHSSNYVIYQNNLSTGEAYLVETDRNFTQAGGTISAEIYISSVGKISLETLDLLDSYYYPYTGQLQLTGAQNQRAWLEFVGTDYYGGDYLAFLVDNTGDGTADIGAYYNDSFEFFAADMGTTTLVPVASLGFSPEVGQPYLQSYAPKTTDTIVISPGYTYDRDTPTEDLVVSYEWAINSNVVVNNTGTTLAPYQAKAGDIVTVVAVVSDGNRSSRSTALSIEIFDSPTVLSVQDLPSSIEAGDTLTFTAIGYDPDLGESGIPANIISAPSGTTIDANGMVTWTASNTTLFNVVTVYFGFGIEGSEDTQQFSVKVTSDDIGLPIARSGVEVPNINDAMLTGNFTQVDSKEILLADAGQRISTVQYDGESFLQTWLYPYALPTQGAIKGLHAFNVDDDEMQEFYVVTEQGISLFNDTHSPAKLVWQTERFIGSSAAIDIDSDGILEIAILHSSSSYSSSNWEVTVLSMSETPIQLFNQALSGKSTYVATFGNVDGDSALELVINSGLVYDTSTWANQWFRGDGFGDQYVETGDLDNDGIDEIIAGSSWGAIHIYSLPSKTLLHSEDNSNTCVIKAENVDQDADLELIIGDCQWGQMTAYNWNGSTLEQAWALDLSGHGSKGLVVGNLDEDSDLEIAWGTGQSSSGKDSLILANLGDSPAIAIGENDSIQLDTFVGAGWIEVEPGHEKAIFTVVETNSGYDGQALVQMDLGGSYSVESLDNDNWEGGQYAVATDFNFDGYGDLFLATAQLYNGAFKALQLNDLSTHWSFTGNYDNNVSEVDAFDVNGDDILDVLYVDGSRLNIMDIDNEILIDVLDHTSSIVDFAVVSSELASTLIATSTSTYLELWSGTGGMFTSLATNNEHSCAILEFGNIDDDSHNELICIESTYGYYGTSTLTVFDWDGVTLSVQGEYELEKGVTDLEVNHSEKTLLLAVDYVQNYSNSRSRIQSVSPTTGSIIWESETLVGRVSHRSMHYRPSVGESQDRLMFGTNKAMYLVR